MGALVVKRLQFRNQASTGLQNWTFDGILTECTYGTSYFLMTCHVGYAIQLQIDSTNAVGTKIFCKALLSEMKHDLPWMERLTLITCASMHRKEIHRHLTSKGQTLEPKSPSAWAALCGNGVILGPYFFDGNVNGLAYLRMLNEFAFPQLAIHFNNQFWEGLFRGLW